MSEENLPDQDHLVRTVKGTWVDGDDIDGAAFHLKQGEPGLSVNWLECFGDLGKSQQLSEVRRLARRDVRGTYRFAELNVGVVRKHLVSEIEDLAIMKSPLEAENGFEMDPSHCEIFGLPEFSEQDRSVIIGEMIAECVQDIHPAKESTSE